MRTLQEKYNAVLEGNFSKTQFRRDAAIEMPQFVSTVNSFDDTVAILKNKGAITEAKKQEPKYTTASPADHIAPDVLDTGIKFELDKKYGTLDVTPEQYEKCRETAIKNLSKDVLYYVKQDSIQLDAPGEKMEKAKLNEGLFDRFKKKPAQSSTAPAEALSADEIQAMIDTESETGTIGDILDAAVVQQTIDLRNATPEQIKTFVSVAREADAGGDTVTGDNYMNYLKELPNYGSIEEAGMLEGISKEEAWKEFQEKHKVTNKTIKVARKDFEKEWAKRTDEAKVEKTFSDGRKELASDGEEMTRKEAEDFIKRAKAHGATPMNTTFKIVNETVDTDELRTRIANILKGQLSSLNKMGGDAIIEDYLETQIQAYLDGDVDIEEPMEVVDDFRYYMDANQSAAHDFNKSLSPDDTTPEKPETLEEGEVVDLPMTAAGYSRGETYNTEKYGKVKIIDQLDGDDIPAAYGRFRIEKVNEDQDFTLTPDEREEKEKEKFNSYYTGEGREALKEMFKKIIVNLINE